MQKLFDSFKWLILAFTGPVGIVLGAIANPGGAVNSFICRIIDVVAIPFPSTPNNLKIVNLLAATGDSIPLVGRAVVYDIFTTAFSMLSIVLLIKIYKLIPFKMS